MKITFVRPNLYADRSFDAMHPLCFAILRSLTPPDVECAFYDERLEPIPLDEPTDLVAMTVETYTARRAYQIATAYRHRGIPVVMGGYHPTFLPDEALQFADAVVVGDAEGVWPHVVEDARRGRLQPIYRQDAFAPLAGSAPDRSIFRGKRYAPLTLVQYGRGCKYNCSFCSIHAFYGSVLRQRPVDEVVEEIRRSGSRTIFLVDDNIFVDLPKAVALFEALIPLRISWSCQVSIDIAHDPALVRLMARSGCINALVGFESLNRANLAQMRKAWNLKYHDYQTSIRVFQRAGIMIYGTFVFGYDQDTVESFDEAVDFAIRNKFYLANFNPLTPTPGADLYRQLEREKRLIYDRWWLHSDYRYGQATFHPRGMTADELTAGCLRARVRFNTLGSLVRRALAPRTNLRSPYRFGIYLLSNLISKREIFAKQGRRLGSASSDSPLPGWGEGSGSRRMKITFIMPNIGRQEHSLYVDEARMEPLSLGVLAGLTPPDVDCVLHDDRMEEIPYDEPTDLVAISIEIYAARRAYEIAAEYRQRGVPVILGGAHPTLFPEECCAYADSVYIGDAEFRWAEVVDDARHHRLQPVYHAKVGVAQPGGVKPRRDLFKGKGYLPIALMQFSRGCRFACEFCAVSAYFNKTNYIRPTEEVLDEIRSQDRKYLFFVDDNLLSNQEAAKTFLRALIPLKVRWVSQASLDMTNDLELMELLARSGCLGNVVGFESISRDSVRLMKKAPNLMQPGAWDCYQRQVEVLRDFHLQSWATFTLGHDYDTIESIERTHEFAMRNRFCFAAYNILMPYPGTPLYDRLQREGRLLYDGKWWLHPEYRFNEAAFVPRNMSPAELTDVIWQCRDKWNRPWSIFWRMWDFKTHMSSFTRLALYLAYNPLYAKESYKKQGMLFGRNRKAPTTASPRPTEGHSAPGAPSMTALAAPTRR